MKIHYLWSFFSSILFLSPIITLFYKYHGLTINSIIFITSIKWVFSILLEIPTSALGDTIGRVKVLKLSVLSTLVSLLIYFLFPSIFMFYIAIFFSALGIRLWSGTGHAKLQEDLEFAGMKKDFGKVLGRLIALQRIGQLLTPIVIFFVLKYFSFGFTLLALLDVIFWIITIFFVFKFREINSNNIVTGKSFKEKLYIQGQVFKKGFTYLIKNKGLLYLILVMIFANDVHFIGQILLPNLAENGVENFVSSFVVWGITFAGILGSIINHKIGDKFGLAKTLIVIIFINTLLHFIAFFFFDYKIIFTSIYIVIAFISGIYAPIWNHLLMNFSELKEKATVRSVFLTVIGLFEFLVLFSLSFVNIKNGILFLAIMMGIGFIFGIKFLLKYN